MAEDRIDDRLVDPIWPVPHIHDEYIATADLATINTAFLRVAEQVVANEPLTLERLQRVHKQLLNRHYEVVFEPTEIDNTIPETTKAMPAATVVNVTVEPAIPKRPEFNLTDAKHEMLDRLPFHFVTKTRRKQLSPQQLYDVNHAYRNTHGYIYSDLLDVTIDYTRIGNPKLAELLTKTPLPFEEYPHIQGIFISWFGLCVRPLMKELKTTQAFGEHIAKDPMGFMELITGISYGTTPAEIKPVVEKYINTGQFPY